MQIRERRGDVQRPKDRGFMKHREKENVAQSPVLLHTSPGTHTHASDRREVGTKDVMATSSSPGVLPTAAPGHPSRSLPDPGS